MIWFLALRSLRLRPLRTFLTTLGIAVAVGSTVIFLSLGEGMRQAFANEIGGIGPDLQVSYGPFDPSSLTVLPQLPIEFAEALAAEPEVSRVIPLLLHVRGGFTPNSSFLFQGLPPQEDIGSIYHGYELIDGRPLSAEDQQRNVGVIGDQLARRRELGIGDSVAVNPQHSFEIVGIARSSAGLVDNGIIVPLEPLQAAIGLRDRISFLALSLHTPQRAAEVAEDFSARYPDLGFQTREDVLGVVEQGIRISDVMRLGISTIALIVGAIAVANTVLMSVFERTREFGVVRALGARPRFLFGLVLAEAVLLSLVGAAFGLLLGRFGIVLVNAYARTLIGLDVAALTFRLLLFAVAVAMVMGLGSGLLPAARAARIPIASAMARE